MTLGRSSLNSGCHERSGQDFFVIGCSALVGLLLSISEKALFNPPGNADRFLEASTPSIGLQRARAD